MKRYRHLVAMLILPSVTLLAGQGVASASAAQLGSDAPPGSAARETRVNDERLVHSKAATLVTNEKSESAETAPVQQTEPDNTASTAFQYKHLDPWAEHSVGEPWAFPSGLALRFGWWGVGTDGSKTKTGEFQDLESSPFWDVDGLITDGARTLDFTLTGLDNEASDARLQYYGSDLWAKFRYERFLRRWDHDPLNGTPFPPGTPYPPGDPGIPGDVGNVRTQDLNVGEDYAIRVQEFDARFGGRLSDNLKWRLNLWGMQKFGERQSTAIAHCFNTNVPAAAGATGNSCHVLSQRQVIDWTTVEIQPAIEARLGHATLEYSRTMRSLGQDDQFIDRTYTRFNFNLPALSGFEGPPYIYGFVPENFTEIDRLKISVPLSPCTQFYGNIYHGNTHNEFRETDREFSGFDLRLTNRSIDNVTLTGYASMDDENNELPPFFFKSAPFSPPAPAPTPTVPNPQPYDKASQRHPVDRTRTRAGLRGNWRPFADNCYSDSICDLSGFSMVAGYEFYELERDHATFPITLSANPVVEGTFTQQDTITHQIEWGPAMRWTPSLDSYIRYKARFIEDPLIGVREHNGAFNSNQPEQEHGVEIGGTWSPSPTFLATTQVGFINRWHQSEFADFVEDDYPVVCTVWYAPCDRLSFTTGYAYYSNWIDQDITLGFTVPGVPPIPARTETTRWNYGGENHLVSIGAIYALTPCVRLLGGFEWNRGSNVFSVPASPAGADWSLLPSIADVVVETQRLTAGLDWHPYANLNLYLRYVYFDWEDISSGLDSGTAHMALAGLTLLF